jgi:hypothetical protein
MNDPFTFGQDPNLTEMKQSIADRAFNIKMKGMFISIALAAVAIGALVVFPQALGVAAPLVGFAAAGGSALAGIITLKETKKLQIDEEFLQSRMQGKNYWGGYREEVGDSMGAPSPFFGGQTPPRSNNR